MERLGGSQSVVFSDGAAGSPTERKGRELSFKTLPEMVSYISRGVEGLSLTASHAPWVEAGSHCPGEGFSEDNSGRFPKSF